jgi:myosin heavy subunit
MAEVKNDADKKLDAILSHLDSASEKMDAINKRMDAAEEERKADRAKIDAACGRMDSFEKERKDASEKEEEEKKKADAARKDAEEEEKKKDAKAKADAEEEEKKKADAAKADGSEHIKRLQAQIDALTRSAPAAVPADLRQRITTVASKWERVCQAFGDSAGVDPYTNGETELDYRIRLASKFKKHSKTYKDADLSKVQDATIFDSVESTIYADALTEAVRPTDMKPGMMIPQKSKDPSGREITRYIGHADACWDQFNPPIRYARRLLTPGSSRLQ